MIIGKVEVARRSSNYYEDKLGNRQCIEFGYGEMSFVPQYLDENGEDHKITISIEAADTVEILEYAIFLDRIFKTDIERDLLNDYEEFLKKPKRTTISIIYDTGFGDYYTRDMAARSRVFKNLLMSYRNIAKECKKTSDDYRKNETANRRKFYEQTAFKEGIKQNGDFQTETVEQVTDLNNEENIEQTKEGETK